MNSELLKTFKIAYNSEAELISRAPGRLEILGNHTDYNEGYVLSTAVNFCTTLAIGPSSDHKCRVLSPSIETDIRSFSIDEISIPLPTGDWTNYVRGVIAEFHKRGYQIKPFNAVISGTVPLSAGMSSSASFEMAMVSGICELSGLEIDLMTKAKIGQGCENNYIGANTGLMDQLSSLAGKKDHLVFSEYRDHSVKTLPFPEGYSLIVFDSGVKHDLSKEYNDRRQQCEEAVSILKKNTPGIKSLRDISLEEITKRQHELPEIIFRRAMHIVSENDRVLKGIELLKNGQIKEFGKLLFESQKSSSVNFENSCEELDFLVSLAEQSPLCIGARLSGGGFGGISIHLTANENCQQYIDYIQTSFTHEYGSVPGTYICHSDEGAQAAPV